MLIAGTNPNCVALVDALLLCLYYYHTPRLEIIFLGLYLQEKLIEEAVCN